MLFRRLINLLSHITKQIIEIEFSNAVFRKIYQKSRGVINTIHINFPDPAAEQHLNVGMQHSMRLFRAQRNFYISGFAIFLSLVIRRLISLITSQAQLLAQSEASMKQAQSATAAARSLLSQQKKEDEAGDKPKPSAPSADEVSVRAFGNIKFKWLTSVSKFQ